MLGVVKEVPVPNKFPPVGASYQFIVPAEATACSVTVPVSHREAGVVDVMDGAVLMVAVIRVLGILEQFPFVAST